MKAGVAIWKTGIKGGIWIDETTWSHPRTVTVMETDEFV